MPEIIQPTVGRRIWFWPNGASIAGFAYEAEPTPSMDNPLGQSQPCDAGICYVRNQEIVNVTVADQAGTMFAFKGVKLVQADERPPQRGTPYVQWMPYQQGQAKAQAPAAAPAPAAQATMLLDFGTALNSLRNGLRMQRVGWNGKGMYVELQRPDAGSKMTLPYIFMKTADNQLVPWLASQTDILANDWQIAFS